MSDLILYGATGYTGRLTARRALEAGLPVTLAGRSAEALAALAFELGTPYRCFSLDDPATVGAGLAGASALLNCAGPYRQSAAPLMEAALRTGCHYLDVSAEIDSYRRARDLNARAKAAGVMLLPGSGGSVAMLGTLAAHAVARVAQPRAIAVALRVSGPMSRGSVLSAAESVTSEILVLHGGKLVPLDGAPERLFDFGQGAVDCFAVTLPDLLTIGRSTSIGEVGTFVHISGGAFPPGGPGALADGPTEAERAMHRYQAVAEVTGADGRVTRSLLDTANGYSFTPLAAAEAARRVLSGEVKPGFRTPAGLFGAGFAETIADTRIIDL
ncbi:trans-acting enoyl reductase family protein [Oceanicella sp. SM1341]|uniref:saccharopine dehydrogenase family protein n=1 Tax=Oceanicella sp. SM1341 TaxID=1548889 RepID=UPI000E4B6238|nr:saccharopine dehydrogenase NADP-binding domain-containing protein [Oceanicella sp. SM1341]